MINIKINKDANEYILKNNIEVLTIYLQIIPCGCARPGEMPVADIGLPEDTQNFNIQIVDKLTLYVSKHLKVPNNTIELIMQQGYSEESKLHPTGIEYFIKGVGNYCNLPDDESE